MLDTTKKSQRHEQNTMITTTESTQQYDVLQKWELPFRGLMDEIYYSGYTKQLMEDDPEEYSRQYWYFIRMYQ